MGCVRSVCLHCTWTKVLFGCIIVVHVYNLAMIVITQGEFQSSCV